VVRLGRLLILVRILLLRNAAPGSDPVVRRGTGRGDGVEGCQPETGRRGAAAIALTILEVRSLLRLRKRREVGRVEGEGRFEVGEKRGSRSAAGRGKEGSRREGKVGTDDMGEASKLVLHRIEAGAELGFFGLLEVELRTEAVVLILEVCDPAIRRRRC
jgi:hypothetical protein